MSLNRISPAQTPERILIYGDPKTGKTRLATSLPERFGNIIYFAADPGAESLAPVLSLYRSRITVVKPGGGASEKYDPDIDAFTFALHNWSAEKPVPGTLVWDTLTATSLEILAHLADTGAFSERAHIKIGGGAAPQHIPMQGDYMAAQGRINRLLSFLFRSPLNLIILCHATYDEMRNGEAAEGGPATSGKATVRSLPGKFDTVLHTSRRYLPSEKPGGPNRATYSAFTERHGLWSAGVRSSLATNPIPVVELDPDPINFWALFDSHFRKETP